MTSALQRLTLRGFRHVYGDSHIHFRSLAAPRALYWDLSADAFLISYPKCGRTWLRFMMGSALVEHFGLDASVEERLELDGLGKYPGVPWVRVTHAGQPFLCRPEEFSNWAVRYVGKKVIFLARDPRDVLVSIYFQLTKRQSHFVGTLPEFVMADRGSLRTIVSYYNSWLAKSRFTGSFHMVKYEELRSDPARELTTIARFLDMDPSAETIERAVAAATFDRMRALETDPAVQNERLSPKNKTDKESYKTRRGKVGGYVDYLDEGQREIVDAYIRRNLDPAFGY